MTTATDWNLIAKLAGQHGIRYRTNGALEAFLSALPAPPSVEARADVVRERLTRQLHSLAVALHRKHYADVPQWQPLPDAEGLLSQIDNMTTGLCRANHTVANEDRLRRTLRAIAELSTDGAAVDRALAALESAPAEPGRVANPSIGRHLISIADASVRADGSDIPLGETCRAAAAEIERLAQEVHEQDLIIIGCKRELSTLKAEGDARVKAAVERAFVEGAKWSLTAGMRYTLPALKAAAADFTARAAQADLGQEVGL